MMLVGVFLLNAVLAGAACAAGVEVSAAQATSRPVRSSVFERLSLPRLERFDRDRGALAARLKRVVSPYPLVRGTFHMHSRLSHDSKGTSAEIIAAAKATGTKIVGLTEHPSETADVIAENIKGWHEGVLFLAGIEEAHVLLWPGSGGEPDLRLISHPEGVPSLGRSSFAGMEIYNTHSDAKDEPIKRLVSALILNLPAIMKHPEAAFESFLDYPASFMARYDRFTLEAPFSGVAANDSHQNQGFRVLALPEGGVEIRDGADEVIWRNDGVAGKALLAALGHTKLPDRPTSIVEWLLDPYEISMRHVGTYLQIGEINARAVRKGLSEGRIVLAFENIAPLRGFGFWAEAEGKPVGTMGDRIGLAPGLRLRAELPLEAEIRIIRDGGLFSSHLASQVSLENPKPGVYRLEAWLPLAGELWPWVITNPIYLTDKPLKEK
ncbi:MAG: PHP domain-containing protein [Phycisphaerae bacterium]|nr:PHP domain-containing protein [Phycisphaerae bacterium]